MIFDITNNNIEYNSSIYDCKDKIDYIYNIKKLKKKYVKMLIFIMLRLWIL